MTDVLSAEDREALAEALGTYSHPGWVVGQVEAIIERIVARHRAEAADAARAAETDRGQG